MDQDAIVNFSDDRGLVRRKPALRDILTDDQREQVRYARKEGVTWRAISLYFQEGYGMEYGEMTWKRAFANEF